MVNELRFYYNKLPLFLPFLQQKMEEAQREKEELVKNMAVVQQEKEQLEVERERLQNECEQEKETCAQLRRENQVRTTTSPVCLPCSPSRVLHALCNVK